MEKLRIYLKLILLLSPLAQCNQIDVMKIANVTFPSSGCCKVHHWAATASAPQDKDIPAFTVCYRMLIDSYNDELFHPFAAENSVKGAPWYVLDRMCWKCGRGSEGYQAGILAIGRNIPGGGVGKKAFPNAHQYNMARDIAISKWTHTCYSYSSVSQNVHKYQDGLKVFNFTYTDEKENPLSPTAFAHIRIGSNMRGLVTDLQIFNRFFQEDEMVT